MGKNKRSKEARMTLVKSEIEFGGVARYPAYF